MDLLWTFAWWLFLWFVPVIGVFFAVYYLISLPLRRQERARFFLHLIETGLKEGRSPEHTIVAIAHSRDTSVGVRFHLLAAHLESGCRFVEALEKVPGLLPAQIMSTLKAGLEIGDLPKVLPACQKLLKDAVSQTRAAFNYQIVLAFALNPLVLIVIPTLSTKVLPTLLEVSSAFGIRAGLASWLIKFSALVLAAQVGIMLLLYFGALYYVGGARFSAWLEGGIYPISDWIFYCLPWRRKRMQRNFSALLAVLLDGEVPEDQAVALAAESTANSIFIRRAEKVVDQLRQGMPLTEAINQIDDTGEFRWRLTNACHSQGGFLQALSGWHDALDAKAFQQEQATAQVVTSAMVLLNGICIILVVGAFFQNLAAIVAGGMAK